MDASAIDFSFSLSFDYVLLPYDIAVNKAHSMALESAGVLTKQERVDLHKALDEVLNEAEAALNQNPSDEDVHSFVERLVIEKIGDLGKKMHTGKSRNDQVATDVRLYLKDQISDIDGLIHDTMRSLYDFANQHKETVFPGFTHLQIAQPVVLGHHILAYLEKLNVTKIDLLMLLSEQMCARWGQRLWLGQIIRWIGYWLPVSLILPILH